MFLLASAVGDHRSYDVKRRDLLVVSRYLSACLFCREARFT